MMGTMNYMTHNIMFMEFTIIDPILSKLIWWKIDVFKKVFSFLDKSFLDTSISLSVHSFFDAQMLTKTGLFHC